VSRLSRFKYVHLAGFREDEYELYRLDERRPEEARRYLSAGQVHNVIRPALNDWRYAIVLEDKWLFARVFDRVGISAPRTLGVIHPLWGATWTGEPLRTAADLAALLESDRARELVIKPVAGYQGRQLVAAGVEIGRQGVRLRIDGSSVPLEDFVASLPPEGFHGLSGFIVQERVRAHPDLAELNPDALNSLRVHTFVRGDGSVQLHSAILRLGRRGEPLEGLSAGAIAVEVTDHEHGILGEGVVRPAFGGGSYQAHPDTGVPFSGRKLPHWKAVVELAMRAARVVPALRVIGWDIAITPEGPSLIEGNADWNPNNAQAHGRGYLGDEIRRELVAAGAPRPEVEPGLAAPVSRLRRRIGRIAISRVFRWSGLDPHADRWS
jgi:hypothetical protein